ncbi:transcriptional regulatory protein GAL4 [Lophiostoma macrostomum CBS 122681]|uniref:Transcriptional regulatory protein GAL4 n=1 Tax=Lophiostoma macrostomum CBS 122681 TaxID=1314788 RepID=A0A6A6SVI3_9PLEO|nr:transcriptional regulatory protein GAL4 [Lophiostoma macrostomum CBS 122681]
MASPNGHQLVTPATDDNGQPVSRKPKRNGERVRVTRACDRCKRRKIKCDGKQPCSLCYRVTANCTYESAYARGRAPSIRSTSDTGAVPSNVSFSAPDIMPFGTIPSSTGRRYSELEMNNSGTAQETLHPGSLTSPSNSLAPKALAYVVPSSANSPDPSQTDLQGHYIGPASGVSFLLRVQKRLEQAMSFSDPTSIFTFGDAPLHPPEYDPSFCMMLPRDDAQRLVDRYFDFAMPTYRFLHRPTIQDWFAEFYDTLGVMRNTRSAPTKVALLFMVFAQGRVYMPDSDRPGPSDLSARYYLAAEHQLSREKGSVRLASVQARLLQCFYLLTQSRINHCWSLFGTVSRLGLAIGLNRSKRPDRTNGLGYVEAECRRRTFWCSYTLDAYLSSALGRSPSFHDEDIDTELPACIDDSQLTADRMDVSSLDGGQSVMLAPLAHFKLARIVSKILRNLYSIKPISFNRRVVLTDRISKDLSDWRVELARFLDADYFSTSFLVPIFQRQRNVLNLTYWHAVILTHRPFLLDSLARPPRQDRSTEPEDSQTTESVQQCLVAAMNTVKTLDEMTSKRQVFRAYWITAYFGFTANIVLYLFVITKRASSAEVYREYLSAATRCQFQISAMAEKGSLPERYCLVLEELRNEALRQTERAHSSTMHLERMDDGSQEHGFQTASMAMDANSHSTENLMDFMEDATVDLNDIPDSVNSDYAGWDQFASMVSSGLGNLDAFINDDTFTF